MQTRVRSLLWTLILRKAENNFFLSNRVYLSLNKMNLSWFFIIAVFLLFELFNKYCKMRVLNASKDSSLELEQANQGHVECFVQLYCTYLINKFPREEKKKKKRKGAVY